MKGVALSRLLFKGIHIELIAAETEVSLQERSPCSGLLPISLLYKTFKATTYPHEMIELI